MDGSFTDWDGAPSVALLGMDPADDGFDKDANPVSGQLAPLADIRRAWACHDETYFFLRLEVGGGVDFGLGEYSFYLDTDDNTGTGYQVGWGTVGADYRLWNGNLYQYGGSGTDWNWSEITGAYHAVGTVLTQHLEVAAERIALDWTNDTAMSVFVMVSDKKGAGWEDDISDFMPENGNGGVLYPRASGLLTVDGDFSDWDAEPTVELLGADGTDDGYDKTGTNAPGHLGTFADIQNAWAVRDDTYLFVRLDLLGSVSFGSAEYSVYIDTDRNSGTGYGVSWGTVGAEYRFWNGGLYAYAGDGTSWVWTPVEQVPYAVGISDPTQMELAIPRSAVDWASDDSIALFFMASDRNGAGWEDDIDDFLPENGEGGATYPYIPSPDLVVPSVTCSPASPTSGVPAVVTVQVENTGPGDTADFDVTIWIASVAQPSNTVSGLTSGSSTNVIFDWTPSAPGPVWIGAMADSGHQVLEAVETNNENGINIVVE
jgi:hypothetical protein